jgi:hypothetical protein
MPATISSPTTPYPPGNILSQRPAGKNFIISKNLKRMKPMNMCKTVGETRNMENWKPTISSITIHPFY